MANPAAVPFPGFPRFPRVPGHEPNPRMNIKPSTTGRGVTLAEVMVRMLSVRDEAGSVPGNLPAEAEVKRAAPHHSTASTP